MFSRRKVEGFRLGAAVMAATLGVMASVAPARAQFFDFWNNQGQSRSEAAPPNAVYKELYRRGFRLVRPIKRNGGVYLADVRDRFGRRERLVIDAYSGAILQAFASRPPQPPGYIPRSAPHYPPSAPVRRKRSASVVEVPSSPAAQDNGDQQRSNERRDKEDLTRREPEPKRLGAVHPSISSAPSVLHTPVPKNGSAQPSPAPSAAQLESPRNPDEPAKKQKNRSAPKQEAQAANPVQKGSASASGASASPQQTPAPPKASGPGYANGVPINPLD